MALFAPADKHTETIQRDDWEAAGGDPDDWDPNRSGVCYTCSCAEMRDRLELLGFTLKVATEAFQIGASAELKRMHHQLRTYQEHLMAAPPDVVVRIAKTRRNHRMR